MENASNMHPVSSANPRFAAGVLGVPGAERQLRCAKAYRSCIDQLQTFMEQTGFTDVVLGLSGGIDSSLAAVIAVDALGASHVHGILLPGPYTSDMSNEDAYEIARLLDIEVHEISIALPFKSFEQSIEAGWGIALDGLAAQNTQARCRMVCLMALSNTFGWMLLNTGNKSEAAMGYSTLYGDAAGAYAPLGNLYKTEVYALTEWRNAVAREKGEPQPIPQRVIERPPSAELAPDQEDEKSFGVSYEVLDRILIGHFERGESAEGFLRDGLDEATVRRVLDTYEKNAFKRRLLPPAPKRIWG